MQQIPFTSPSFTFHSAFEASKVSTDSIPPYGNPINLLKKQSVSPEDQSLKRRLQIFKQYKVRSNSVSENDDTVVYNRRRPGVDSQKGKGDLLPTCQRQFQQCEKLNRYGSGAQIGQSSGKRRNNIFSASKPSRLPKYHLSMKSMQQSQREELATTQRIGNNIEKFSPIAQQPTVKSFFHFSANTDNKSTNNISNIYSRAPSLQKFKIQGQAQQNLISPCEPNKEMQNNLMISPKKITFTYQNPGVAQNLTVPKTISFNLLGYQSSQALVNRNVNINQQSKLPRSLVSEPSALLHQSTAKLRSYNEKKTVNFVERSVNTQIRTNQPGKLSSWGSKIRTELMGAKSEFQEKSIKFKDPGSSKVSHNQVKQSLIINGEKIARDNLKINESLSNISDNHSSRRYFDEEIDLLPQVKKISYNNIDICQQQFFQDHEDFNPHQLLLELESHKFQNKHSESLQVAPVKRPQVKIQTPQQPILQKTILKELSQQIKPVELVKQTNKAGKLFPVVLILLATLLFMIQAFL